MLDLSHLEIAVRLLFRGGFAISRRISPDQPQKLQELRELQEHVGPKIPGNFVIFVLKRRYRKAHVAAET